MKKKTFKIIACTACAALLFTGCGAPAGPSSSRTNSTSSSGAAAPNKSGVYTDGAYYEATETDGGMYNYYYDEFNTEEYSYLEPNGFRSVAISPLSTFAADVDTASYANLRRMLNYGYEKEDIPKGAVRAEEMINYFSYDYDGPKKGEPFGVNVEISECPWNSDNVLLMLGLQTEKIDFSDAPDSNIVFLIDVSGSMDSSDKLPLLQDSLCMLVDELDEKDTVSIVTYSGYFDVVLEGVSADKSELIKEAINRLYADGSTNGGDAINEAYKIAEKYYIEGGVNRVIMATDGDLNVGVTSESALETLISEKKESGVFLSILGFGTGNYSDSRLEILADKGNGNYSYIDSIREAKKVLVEELGANMVTVAKDVKLQIEFNPKYVSEYRQIGYENREINDEDFDNDEKDGGEIGAGHSVTVLYELVPAKDENGESSLKYQKSVATDAADSDEWCTLSIRYKEPEGDKSQLLSYPIEDSYYTDEPSDDFLFAACVAEFAMYLSDSEYLENGSLRQIKDILSEMDFDDEAKDEFADLVYMLR